MPEAAAQEQVARTLFADMLSRAADSGMPTGDGVAPSRSLERKDLRAILMAMGLEPALLQRLLSSLSLLPARPGGRLGGSSRFLLRTL